MSHEEPSVFSESNLDTSPVCTSDYMGKPNNVVADLLNLAQTSYGVSSGVAALFGMAISAESAKLDRRIEARRRAAESITVLKQL